MGKLRIMTGNAIKRSNRTAIKKYNANMEKNTSRHFAKLHGGFDNPRANPEIRSAVSDLKKVAYMKDGSYTKLDIKTKKSYTQDKINELIQDTIIKNIKRAFGEGGFTNSTLTKGQMEQIETRQKQLLAKLNKLHFEKRNLAIKEMTRNLTRISNHYLGDEVYKKDSRTEHILINHILKSFDIVENKYVK